MQEYNIKRGRLKDIHRSAHRTRQTHETSGRRHIRRTRKQQRKEKKRKLVVPNTARKFDSNFKTTFRNLYGAIGETSFLVKGLGDRDVDFLSIVEVCLDFVAEFAFGDLHVVLCRPFSSHQAKEIVINIDLGIISSGTTAIEVMKGWIPIDIQF